MEMNFQMNFGSSVNTESPVSQDKLYDLLIIGGGPAGLNAALYAKRKGLETAIVTKRKGGQLLDTSMVDNYLGIDMVSGEGMVHQFVHHLEQLDVPILEDVDVVEVARHEDHLTLTLSTGEIYRSKTLLVATGSQPRKLGIIGEQTFSGKGVSYCAICDAPFFKGKDVFVAGGGNSAVEAALDLAKVAKSVTLVHRSQIRADSILADQMYENDRITVHLRTRILEVQGKEKMTGLLVKDLDTDTNRVLHGDGLFVEIGHDPYTGPFKNLLELNAQGEIIVSEKNETSVPGIFAAGDVTQVPYKQIIIAASDGAKAALAANEYINQMQKQTKQVI